MRALWTAATGMHAQQMTLDVISNNLANVQTAGFKRSRVDFQQFITLTGIVRPLDIDRDNVVLSTQLADANITIGGLGVVADKQRSGWGTWFFDFVWPF